MTGRARALAAGALLLTASARTAVAQTTSTTLKQTTTTTTSTTTTLQPHKFSAGTSACIRQARQQFGSCRLTPAKCSADFQTGFAKCFAGTAGQSCAAKCVSREATCLSSAPATKQTCRKNCNQSRAADVRACKVIAEGDTIWASGDAACLATAEANFHVCRFACAEAELDCRTNFQFCIADCPNL